MTTPVQPDAELTRLMELRDTVREDIKIQEKENSVSAEFVDIRLVRPLLAHLRTHEADLTILINDRICMLGGVKSGFYFGFKAVFS